MVKATIQHYSGRNEKNIAGIYYEVWNEPDLFGQWQIGKEPDYRTLYVYALSGAFQAQDCQPFKIGGPG
ncbi:glycoside hydrolase, partial [Candidatus Saccharibacteria bacterium]|nr:glycoside hydrolase [Candidatus Saccharibacteria bacterium]